MTTLCIHLFGGFKMSHAARLSELRVTRAVRSLLAFLLLNRHRVHPREILADLFWGEHPEDRARSCLSTALWRLRRALEPGDTRKGTYLITTSSGEVGFNRDSEHWLDVAVFEDEAAPIARMPIEIMEGQDAANLEKALELYIGDLLEGFYEDWALRERERLRALYLNSLAHLMGYHRYHREYEKAIRCGQEILKHDPLREEVHRGVMRIYFESGRRTLAIRQYKACCRMLMAELDVPPMEETQTLYTQILNATCSYPEQSNFRQDFGEPGPQRWDTASSKEPQVLEQAYQNLQLAMQQFEKTKDNFQLAILLFEQALKRS